MQVFSCQRMKKTRIIKVGNQIPQAPMNWWGEGFELGGQDELSMERRYVWNDSNAFLWW